jgi:hypothetical protein
MKDKRSGICLSIAIFVCAFALGAGSGAHAQQPNRVGLVVVHGDGSTITRCIAFNESEISGYDVLQRSGLEIVAAQDSGMGAAICAIDGEGCPVSDCFCECKGTCIYWSYWHLEGGDWVYSQVGTSVYKAHNGDVEGWRWGEGDPLPVISFDQICAPPATDTPVPTDTPAPSTDTPPPPTPTVWFRLDANPIDAGTCTVVRWDTSNAAEVYLDGERVALNGSREVCPTVSQEYNLRVVSATGEQTHTLVLGVTGAPPTATTSATAVPPTPTSTASSATVAPADSAPHSTSTPTITPQPLAVGAASPPSITPPEPSTAPLPANAPQLTVAARQPASDAPTPSSSPGTGYIVFGGIILGLAGLLAVLLLRRR